MTYNIIVNDNIHFEGLNDEELDYEIDRLTLSDCLDFFPNYDNYVIRVEYIEDGEVIDHENIKEYTEGDITEFYEKEQENRLFHEWQDLIEW